MRIILFICYWILLISCKKKLELTKVIILKDFSSGSAMVSAGDKIYLAGDDASFICVTDKYFNIIDTITLEKHQGKRIPKPVKHDIEAATLIQIKKQPYILFAGSGSLSPYRNTITLIDVKNGSKNIFNVETIYERFKAEGIEQLNIEGAASLSNYVIFANRGNKSYRKNHLIFTSPGFWNEQRDAPIHIMTIGTNTDTLFFNGVSGLEYSPLSDRLIMTVSTEETYDSQTDGIIGKSYLWIIHDISSKTKRASINPDQIIDLEQIDKRFTGQKIESVCILEESRKQITLGLVADNDDGTSVLFKLELDK